MQKQTLILLIGYLLVGIISATAQTNITVGTGTNNSYFSPINRYYSHSAAELLYTAAEINSTGFITKLAFEKASGNTSVTIDDVSIYLKTTTANALSSGTTTTGGYTLVWTGSFPNTMPSGWAEVTLNTAFYYNGTDNLQVLVIKGNQSYSFSRPYYNYTSTSPTSRARRFYSDSSPWSTSSNLSSSNDRPNIRLTLTTPTANDAGISGHNPQLLCPGNSNITATLKNYGTQALTSATINWSINGTAQAPINWTGSLASNSQTTVNLGNYTFTQGVLYTIDIATANPNGTTDGNAANDAYNSAVNLAFTGTYTVGGTNPTYPTLTAAITDLVNNGLCGPVVLELRDGTYNGAITIPAINGLSSTNTLTIRPEASANNVVITSNDAEATITLDGADYVTIDGRSGGMGTNSALDVDNTNNDGSTIYLVNGATNNIVEYCHVRNYCWESSKGVITLGADGFSVPASAGGNSNNIFRYNHIRESNSGSTYQGIVSQASTSNTNKDNLLHNNSIYNYDTEGILLKEGNEHWTIRNNSFFQLASRSGHMIGIQIEDGTGYTISNNHFGGSDINMGGTPTTATGSGRFTGIKIESGVGTGTVDILANKISNIKTAYYFNGIELRAGTINIANNQIGGKNATEKIESEWRPAVGIDFYGSTVDATIENNEIGNIHFNSSSSSQNYAYGIEIGAGKATIRDNNIFDITSNGTYNSFSIENNMAAGIYIERSAFVSGGPYPISIERNSIHGIHQVTTSDQGPAAAIYIEDEKNTDFTIAQNKIYDINSTSTSHAGFVWGIYANTEGTLALNNNQIKVGRITGGVATVKGIEIASSAGTIKTYYNTIVVDGIAGASASNASFCFLRTNDATFDLLNNAFFNNRSGGTAVHYCVGNNSANTSNWASNYNLFCGRDMNALNQWGAADRTFDAWKTATTTGSSWADDITTINLNNLFDDFLTGLLDIDPTQTESWYLNGKGVQIPSITADVNSVSAGRSTLVIDGGTDIGANEFTPTVVPQELTVTGSPTLGGIQIFSFANRPVAQIEWGNTGTLPTVQSAQYYSGTSPNDPTNNGSISSPKHYNAYWKVEATGGSNYTYTMTLLYDDALLGTISSEAQAKLAKKETGVVGTWQTHNSTVNNATNELSYAGLDAFSEFTALLDASNILPVDLLSFTGQKVGSDVALQWVTSSETNNAYFTIQKSTDGINWTQLDTVAGQGTTTAQTTYNYTDVNPYSGANYYRLLQTDFNGNITNTSNVIIIYFDTSILKTQNGEQYFWVNSQNEICLMSTAVATYQVELYDLSGKHLYQVSYNVVQGLNKLPLHLNNIPTNVYILTIGNTQEKYSQKVLLKGN